MAREMIFLVGSTPVHNDPAFLVRVTADDLHDYDTRQESTGTFLAAHRRARHVPFDCQVGIRLVPRLLDDAPDVVKRAFGRLRNGIEWALVSDACATELLKTSEPALMPMEIVERTRFFYHGERTNGDQIDSHYVSDLVLAQARLALLPPEGYERAIRDLIERGAVHDACEILEGGVSILGDPDETIDVLPHVKPEALQPLLHAVDRGIRQRGRLLVGRALLNAAPTRRLV